MATTSHVYTKFAANALGGETSGESSFLDWLSDNVKVALVDAGYTPNQDAHEFFSDITNEAVGAGYTAGGLLLGSKSIGTDAPTNKMTFIAAASVWATVTVAPSYAVVYKSTGVAGTSLLICYVDFGGPQSVTAGPFAISWDATAGVFQSVAT